MCLPKQILINHLVLFPEQYYKIYLIRYCYIYIYKCILYARTYRHLRSESFRTITFEENLYVVRAHILDPNLPYVVWRGL